MAHASNSLGLAYRCTLAPSCGLFWPTFQRESAFQRSQISFGGDGVVCVSGRPALVGGLGCIWHSDIWHGGGFEMQGSRGPSTCPFRSGSTKIRMRLETLVGSKGSKNPYSILNSCRVVGPALVAIYS